MYGEVLPPLISAAWTVIESRQLPLASLVRPSQQEAGLEAMDYVVCQLWVDSATSLPSPTLD